MLNASLRKAYKPAAPSSPMLASPAPSSTSLPHAQNATLSAANPMVIDTTPAYYVVDPSPSQPAPAMVADTLAAPASPAPNTLAQYPPPRKDDREDDNEGGKHATDKQRIKRKRRESRDKDVVLSDSKESEKRERKKKGTKTKPTSGSSLNASHISPKQMGLEGGDSGQADDSDSTISWSIPTLRSLAQIITNIILELIPTRNRYHDLGGIDDVIQEITELIEWPLTHPELYAHLGVKVLPVE